MPCDRRSPARTPSSSTERSGPVTSSRRWGSAPSAEEMAHMPVGGRTGSLAQLADARAGRRIYIHINNTNPMLREDSPERAAVAAAGWEVAWDGMEVKI